MGYLLDTIPFFIVSEDLITNLLFTAFVVWIGYYAIKELFKYLKDWRLFGTHSWNQQWRCRRALEYRFSCLSMVAHYADGKQSDSDAAVEEMLSLYVLWDGLTDTTEYKGAWTRSHKPIYKRRKDYDEKWLEALAISNASNRFGLATHIFDKPYTNRFSRKYGYQI